MIGMEIASTILEVDERQGRHPEANLPEKYL
jgi:hypothetical protein